MRRITTGAVLMLSTFAVPVVAQEPGQHAEAPSEGLRAELIQDVQQLQERYVGLAQAMTGKFDWRPGDGVRSVGEVFGHVANANFMIPSMAGAERGMADRNFEQETDESAIVEGLEHSFTHAVHSIASIPDSELDAKVTMFGREATKRQVLTLLVTHMHEHLGQAIAYARTNDVTPPWSGDE